MLNRKLLLLVYVLPAFCDYILWQLDALANEPAKYHVYEGRTLGTYSPDEVPLIFTVTEFNQCILACPLTGSSCTYLMVKRNGLEFECHIYTQNLKIYRLLVAKEYYPNSVFLITKQKLECSGFCKKLREVEQLCDKRCKCMDGCTTDVMPYWCDCRSDEIPPQKDCMGYKELGFNKSALFLINPDGGENISVFCEIQSDGTASMTMLSRFIPSNTQHHDTHKWNGFGAAAENYIMLSLVEINRITHAFPHVKLHMMAVGIGGERYSADWQSFEVGPAPYFILQVSGFDDHETEIPNLFRKRDGNSWREKVNTHMSRFWMNPDTHKSPCNENNKIYIQEDLNVARIKLSISYSTEKWQLAGREVCWDTIGAVPGNFAVPSDGLLTAVKIHHTSGEGTSCGSKVPLSLFGCASDTSPWTPDNLAIFITSSENTAIEYFPKNIVNLNDRGLYYLPGYHANSKVVIFRDTNSPTFFTKGTMLRIVYGEVLYNGLLSNNRGQTCVDVYVLME